LKEASFLGRKSEELQVGDKSWDEVNGIMFDFELETLCKPEKLWEAIAFI
jgi:hypothetical protein